MSASELQGRGGLGSELVVPDLQSQVGELRLVEEPVASKRVDRSDELLARFGANGELGWESERYQPDAGLHTGSTSTHVLPAQKTQVEPHVAPERRSAFDHQWQRQQAGQDVIEFAAPLGLKHWQHCGMQASWVFRKGGSRERAASSILQFDAVAEYHFALLRVARVRFGVGKLCTLTVIVSTNYKLGDSKWFQMGLLTENYFGLRNVNNSLVRVQGL
jgi:hypothetical protein